MYDDALHFKQNLKLGEFESRTEYLIKMYFSFVDSYSLQFCVLIFIYITEAMKMFLNVFSFTSPLKYRPHNNSINNLYASIGVNDDGAFTS